MKVLLATAAIIATATAGVAQATPYDRYDRHVNVVNRTDEAVVSFFATNTGSGFWKRDLLGDVTIGPNQFVNLDLDDLSGYCRFDFKTVMEDGTVLTRYNVNVCELVNYVINP